jgi:hypothetical protein
MALHGIEIKKANKGKLHADLGVAKGKKLTAGEIAKAKRSSSPAMRKRATFAQNAKGWNKGKKRKPMAERMYGKKESSK